MVIKTTSHNPSVSTLASSILKVGDRIAYYGLSGLIVKTDRKHYTIKLDSMASQPLHTKLFKLRRKSMAIIKLS